MHRLGALLLGASLTLGLGTACGDDIDPSDDGEDGGSDCADTEVDEFPEGQLGSPDQVIAEGIDCPEGGLADVDLSGRWSLFLGGSSFNYQYPYIRESCEDGFELDVEVPGGDPLIHRDDTNLFIRSEQREEEFSYVVAARVCAGPSPDELSVVVGQCFAFTGEEPECLVGPGVMKRFGRPEGEVEADGLELVSEWSGGDEPWPQASATNVKVLDGVAFVSRLSYLGGDEASDLRLVDVADLENPADLGSFAVEESSGVDFNDVKLFQTETGTHAVLSGMTSPVIDASDPTNPVVASNLEYSHSMFIREDEMGRPLAYLANAEANVPIYDLSDPTAPVLLELVETPMIDKKARVGVHDLYAEEDRLYLNGEGRGFYVMDREGDAWTVGGNLVTDGYNHANWVGEIDGRKVAVMGDEGYSAHLQVVDVDPESEEFMTVIGEYQTRPEAGIHNIMLFGTRAYVTYYHDGVRIIDLADPTNPQLVAYYHTWDVETGGSGPFESAIGLDVDPEAGLIYVADMTRGLLILRETK